MTELNLQPIEPELPSGFVKVILRWEPSANDHAVYSAKDLVLGAGYIDALAIVAVAPFQEFKANRYVTIGSRVRFAGGAEVLTVMLPHEVMALRVAMARK